MFLLVSGRHVGAHLGGHQHGVSIQISLNLEKNVSPHIFHKKNCCDLNLGESLCISTFFLFPDSGLTVTYCKKRVAAQREKRNLLCNLVEHLKRKIDYGSTSCVDAYKNAFVNLGKLDLEAANGARVRSRVQWAEEGETSSKYFFRLEKKNKAERWISALKDEDGIIHSEVDGISHVLSSFYSSLFSSEDTIPSAQAVLLNNLETSLSPEQSGLCDGPLSLSECHSSLAC